MIMQCVDKNWVVWETLCARVLLGLGSVWIEASLLGRSGGLHLGNMVIFMRMSEVTQVACRRFIVMKCLGVGRVVFHGP